MSFKKGAGGEFTVRQRSLLKEALIFFACVMALIWSSDWLGKGWTYIVGFLIVVPLLLSFKLRGDSARDIGFCVYPSDLRWWWIGLGGLIVSALILVLVGYIITPNFWENGAWVKKFSKVSFGYALGVPIQQFFAQGYFTSRLNQVWPNRHLFVAGLAGLLFGVVHLPNPVLTIGTWFFGTATAWFFLKAPNLYFLSLTHFILSHLVKNLIASPLIGRGCMQVGPGFWN